MQKDTQKNQTQPDDEQSIVDITVLMDDVLRFLNRFGFQVLLIFAITVAALVGYQNTSYVPSYVAKITYAVEKTGVAAIDSEVAGRMSGTSFFIFTARDFTQDIMEDIKAETVNWNYLFLCESTEETNLITVSVTTNNYKNANILLDSLKRVFPDWVSNATGTVQLQIVDESRAKEVPENPYSFAGVLAISILGGIILCIALFFIYNVSVRTIRKESDMKRVTDKNCIISIPQVEVKKRSKNKKKELLLNKKRIDWDFRQAILAAHLRIEKMMDKKEHQVLMISSTLPQEGKSLIAINLALAFAQHDKKVLLIDGDMRNASVQRILNLPSEGKGLVDFFKKRATLSEILTEGPGFSIMQGGSHKGAVSQFITDAEMNKLINILKKEYDYILIDTPAAYLFGDAAVWAKYADDVVYVVKYDEAHQREIRKGMDTLDQDGKILGYIVNKTPGGFTSYGYGKYGYGKYGYGRYGYGKYGYNRAYSKYIELDEAAMDDAGDMNTEDTL